MVIRYDHQKQIMSRLPRDHSGRVFDPFTIGGRFLIVPPDNGQPAGEGRIRLRMASGAFGSGEHETTAACLELLAGLPPATGSTVLDLGCGTGILAIAAIKLQPTASVDIDVRGVGNHILITLFILMAESPEGIRPNYQSCYFKTAKLNCRQHDSFSFRGLWQKKPDLDVP